MKHMILAAAVALALTGPAEAGAKLTAKGCSQLNTLAQQYAVFVLSNHNILKKRKDQWFEELKKVGPGEKWNNPGLGRLIEENEEQLRRNRTASAEYSTIWRNLCKD